MKTKNISVSVLLLLSITLLTGVNKAQSNEVTVGDVRMGEVDYKGFSLSEKSKVNISGQGAVFDRWDDFYIYYGWILNSDTREVEWHLMDDFYDWDDDEGRFDFNVDITLEAGDYEVYFAAMRDGDNGIHSLGDLLDSIFGTRSSRRKRGHNDDLKMTVSGSSALFNGNDGKVVVDKMAKDAIASFVRMRDDEYQKKGFTLAKETRIQIYAIGEGRGSEVYDYGWIYDVKTSKRVWTMKARFADNAGGGDKNYLVDEEITLPAGTYMAHFVTDGSHSFEEWNVLPPNDPQFWGLTLWAVSPDDMKNVKPFEDASRLDPVVEMIKVRDDRIISQGISLKKPMELRILCLGEESSYNEMADYGWIVDAETRETVWEMKMRKTEHAGGARKNRLIDKIVSFDKGDYVVYYATDDSHSYNDWNSSPPYDRTRWGITIWAVDEEDNKNVTFFNEEEYKSDKVIAQIVRVRDDEYIRRSFTLDKDTRIRVIAIGEGSGRDMSDYGWIKNDDTRRIVWEMTYRKTDHAGGARKNRMYNDSILLEAGEYTLYYETDGSHSYRDWNDTPPQNPEMYGITLMREK